MYVLRALATTLLIAAQSSTLLYLSSLWLLCECMSIIDQGIAGRVVSKERNLVIVLVLWCKVEFAFPGFLARCLSCFITYPLCIDQRCVKDFNVADVQKASARRERVYQKRKMTRGTSLYRYRSAHRTVRCANRVYIVRS